MTDSLSIVSEAPRPRDLERLESRITGATRRLSELQAQLAAANIECQSWKRAALRAVESLSNKALELDKVIQVAADRAECIDSLTAAVEKIRGTRRRYRGNPPPVEQRVGPMERRAGGRWAADNPGRRATDIMPQCPPTCACRGQLP
jgi:hypothetical protein